MNQLSPPLQHTFIKFPSSQLSEPMDDGSVIIISGDKVDSYVNGTYDISSSSSSIHQLDMKTAFQWHSKTTHLRVLPLLWGTSQTTQPPHHDITHEFVPSDMVTTQWKVVYTGKLGNSHFGFKQWDSDYTCQHTQVSWFPPLFYSLSK